MTVGLAYAHAFRANTLARANALANALALARDLASDLDNAEVLVGTLARANALARALADAGALDLAHAIDLDLALNHTRDLACALARDIAREVARDLARDLARDIVRDLVDLDPMAHWARAVVAGGAGSMPGRVSGGLVALAVRLMPVAQQRRYHDELCGELVELPSRERWGYALRLLAGAWELRRALVEAACTPDGAAPRRAKR